MRIENITSAQNPKIKELLALQEKSKLRRSERLFVVEGRRELGHCLDAGFVPRTLFICGEILTEEELNDLLGKAESRNPKVGVVQVPYELYGKIAYRGGTEGVIAEVEFRDRTLESLTLSRNPLVIVLESVEKPGNLGAVLRSADAAGADAVIICDPLTDLYNPNLIRPVSVPYSPGRSPWPPPRRPSLGSSPNIFRYSPRSFKTLPSTTTRI